MSAPRLVYSLGAGPRLTLMVLWAILLGIANVLVVGGALGSLGSGPLLGQVGRAALLVGVPLSSLLLLRRVWLFQQLRVDTTALVRVGAVTSRRVPLDVLQGAAWEERSYYSARQTQTFRGRALRLDLREQKPLRLLAGLYGRRQEVSELLLSLARDPPAGRRRLDELLARDGRRGRLTPWPLWIPALVLFVLGTAGASAPALLDAECTLATVEHGRAAWESGSPGIARHELAKLDACGSDVAVAAAQDLQAALSAAAGDCPGARDRLRAARDRAARPDRAGVWAAAWCDYVQSDWDALATSHAALRSRAGRPTCETAALARALGEHGHPVPGAPDAAGLCGRPDGCLFPADSPPCGLARSAARR